MPPRLVNLGRRVVIDLPNISNINAQSTSAVSSTVTGQQIIPIIDSNNLPTPVAGAIAYDKTTQKLYYSNGTSWVSILTSVSTPVVSYNHVLSANLTIPPRTETMITGWTISPSLTYHTFPEWNLATGEFTAAEFCYLSLTLGLNWKANVSNLGTRYLRIFYYNATNLTTTMVREASTQADPSAKIATTQELTVHLKLNDGDIVYAVVYHDAPISLIVEGGDNTTISGYRLIV